MTIPAVIHIHSKYSFDCLTSTKKIVDEAVKRGVRLLCITDHDTIMGSVAALDYATKVYGNKIKVVLGAEYKSTCGDIIGIGIINEISFRDPEQLVNEIHKQGGVALLPHPYYQHANIDFLASICDAIEIFNGRVDRSLNDKAVKLAEKYNKPFYVASDAHFFESCFNCINYYMIDNDGLNVKSVFNRKPVKYVVSYTDKRYIHLSQAIKGLKSRNISLLYYSLRTYISFLFKKKQ